MLEDNVGNSTRTPISYNLSKLIGYMVYRCGLVAGVRVFLSGSGGVACVTCHYLLGGAGCNDVASKLAALGTNVYYMVGTLHHIEVMLDYNNGVTLCDESVKRIHQCVYIVEMQSRCRLVENKHSGLGLLLSEEVSELNTLVLSTRQSRRRLSELYISKANILQGLQPSHNLATYRVTRLTEELHSLIHGHVQHIVDVFAVVGYFKHAALLKRWP